MVSHVIGEMLVDSGKNGKEVCFESADGACSCVSAVDVGGH